MSKGGRGETEPHWLHPSSPALAPERPCRQGTGAQRKVGTMPTLPSSASPRLPPAILPFVNANWQEAATFLLELLGRSSAESQPLGHRCAKPPTVSHPGWKGQQQQRHMWLFKGIVAPGPETHDMRADQGARY